MKMSRNIRKRMIRKKMKTENGNAQIQIHLLQDLLLRFRPIVCANPQNPKDLLGKRRS